MGTIYKMNILLTNDDGIEAPGILKLASLIKPYGNLIIVAPKTQCSAMSQKITVLSRLEVEPYDFGMKNVKAFQVSGSPADCVKVGLEFICAEKPDWVLSGINQGFNCGYDIAYSGTVGAAMEAIMQGVSAMAFSTAFHMEYDAVDEYLPKIFEELIKREIGKNEIWNVNIPGCKRDEILGIKEVGYQIGQTQFYQDGYTKTDLGNGAFYLDAKGIPVTSTQEGTDLYACLHNYIAIGKVKSMVMI